MDGRPPKYPYPSTLSWTPNLDLMHQFEVRTTDGAGNIEQQNVYFGLDRVKPTTKFTNLKPSFWRCVRRGFKWTATDELSGVKAFSARLDNAPLYRTTVVDMSRLSIARHYLDVSATDFAGNSFTKYERFDVIEETGTVVGPPRPAPASNPRPARRLWSTAR